MTMLVNIEDSYKWDSIVRSFEFYDVCYLSGYAKMFQNCGEGEPLLFYYDDGNTRAINVIMKRDIAKFDRFIDKLPVNTWFDISTPYGYGGFLVEGKNYKSLNIEFNKFCIEQGIISEFVRFHLLSDYRKYYDGKVEFCTHNVIRSLNLSIEELLKDFDHKVRKNINKAFNSGLEFEVDYTGKKLNDFLKIYYSTMDRTSASKTFYFTEDFFKVLKCMENNYAYVHVLYEGKIISTELILYGTENCYSFLGGTDKEYFNLRPNDFLKFETIKWCMEKGLKNYILGGGYGADDGIFKYKKSFAPNGIVDYYIGKKILNKDKYQQLVNICKQEENFNDQTNFFPTYRG